MSEACHVLGLFAMHDNGGRTKGDGEANTSISSSQASNRLSSLDHLEEHLSSAGSVQNCTLWQQSTSLEEPQKEVTPSWRKLVERLGNQAKKTFWWTAELCFQICGVCSSEAAVPPWRCLESPLTWDMAQSFSWKHIQPDNPITSSTVRNKPDLYTGTVHFPSSSCESPSTLKLILSVHKNTPLKQRLLRQEKHCKNNARFREHSGHHNTELLGM